MPAVSPIQRSLSATFAAVTSATSVSKEKISVTEARKLVNLVTGDGQVTLEETAALAAAAERYRDSFSPTGALEFGYLARKAGVGAESLPAPASGARAQAIADVFVSKVGTAKDGTRTVGVGAVRAAYAEALRDGSLSGDEKVGLARLESAIDGAWRVSASARFELGQIRENHRLPDLPLASTGAAQG